MAVPSTPAISESPLTTLTMPVVSRSIMALFGGTSLAGIAGAVVSFAGGAPYGTSSGTGMIGGVVLAVFGIIGVLGHSTDVGRRFLKWLNTEAGHLSVISTPLIADLGKVLPPNQATVNAAYAKASSPTAPTQLPVTPPPSTPSV